MNPAQREELARLQAQIKKLGEVTATILSLAEELKPKTIERQLEKIDSEVGLEFSREVETLESGPAGPRTGVKLPPSESFILL